METPYEVEFYVTADGECPLREFLKERIPKHRAKIVKWIAKLEEYGPHLPRPYADVLEGPIRELRIQFGNLNYRILYFFEKRFVFLTHGMVKQAGVVPHEEVNRAKRYRMDCLNRKSIAGKES